MNYQVEIARTVAKRGYRKDWTDDQFAARQVAKMVEKISELSFCVNSGGPFIFGLQGWEIELGKVGEGARLHFDDPARWNNVTIDKDDAASELADVLVVVYSMADALGVDINELALEKARADIQRGVR